MADLPGDPAEPAAALVGLEVPGARGRCAARAIGGARRGLLRQGVRRDLPRPAAHDRRRSGAARPTAISLAAMFFFAALCLVAGILPGLFIDALAPVVQRAGRRPHAGRRPASSGCRSCRSPRAAAPTTVCWSSCSSLSRARSPPWRFTALPPTGCAAPRPGTAAIPMPNPATQYTASSFAQPIRRVFGSVVFRAREHGRDAAARRYARRRGSPSTLRDLVWDTLYAPVAGAVGFAADRLNRLQFLTIRQFLSLVFAALVILLAGARAMALILDLRRAGRADAAGAAARAAADRPRAQGEGALSAPARTAADPALSRSHAADAQGGGAGGKRLVAVPRRSPISIFAATWVAAALVPTFRTGLLFSWSADLIAIIALLGSARFFLALAGMDVGTSFGGIGSSREVMIASLAEPAMIMVVFTLALVAGSTQLSTMASFMVSPQVGPARLARAGAGRPDHRGDRRERAHSRSTIRPPISSSPWCTRPWCWNIPAAISR